MARYPGVGLDRLCKLKPPWAVDEANPLSQSHITHNQRSVVDQVTQQTCQIWSISLPDLVYFQIWSTLPSTIFVLWNTICYMVRLDKICTQSNVHITLVPWWVLHIVLCLYQLLHALCHWRLTLVSAYTYQDLVEPPTWRRKIGERGRNVMDNYKLNIWRTQTLTHDVHVTVMCCACAPEYPACPGGRPLQPESEQCYQRWLSLCHCLLQYNTNTPAHKPTRVQHFSLLTKVLLSLVCCLVHCHKAWL